jgi:uncharacterized delta-60 repeat protein
VRGSFGRVASTAALVLALAAIVTPLAHAAPGDPDPAFGQGGSVRLFPTHEDTHLRAVAVQPDDKAVLAGGNAASELLVVRLLADGSLDPGFGKGGIVTVPFAGGFAEGRAVAVQPDGKIVVAGGAKGALSEDFMVARFEPDGTLDKTFGAGKTGVVVLPVVSGQDRVEGLSVGAGGKILLTGEARLPENKGEEAGIAVLKANGEPDTGFNATGTILLHTTGKENRDEGKAIAEDPEGGILVVSATGGSGFAIARYSAGGKIDPFFQGGIVRTAIPTSKNPGAAGTSESLTVLPDGRFVVSGSGDEEIGPSKFLPEFAAARYLANGKLDPSFGAAGSGIFTKTVPTSEERGDAAWVTQARNGRLVLAGSYEEGTSNGRDSIALLRLDPGGALDPGFGSGGLFLRGIQAPFGDLFEGASTLDSRERIVVVSTDFIGGGDTEVEVSRFLGDVAPEPPAAKPGPPAGPPAPGATANRPPTVRIKAIPKKLTAAKLKGFSGTASDADGDGLAKVQVALLRKVGGGPRAKATPSAVSMAGDGAKGAKGKGAKRTCLSLRNAGGGFKTTKVRKPKPCPPLWLAAKGTGKWSFKLGATLPPGRYVLQARALDSRGATGPATRVAFQLTAE